MVNRIINIVVASILLFGWFYVARSAYYANAGQISNDWWLASVAMLTLFQASGDGSNPVEMIMGSIKECLPNIITLAIIGVVTNLISQLVGGMGYDYNGALHVIATVAAAGVLTNATTAMVKNSGA